MSFKQYYNNQGELRKHRYYLSNMDNYTDEDDSLESRVENLECELNNLTIVTKSLVDNIEKLNETEQFIHIMPSFQKSVKRRDDLYNRLDKLLRNDIGILYKLQKVKNNNTSIWLEISDNNLDNTKLWDIYCTPQSYVLNYIQNNRLDNVQLNYIDSEDDVVKKVTSK